MKLHVGCQRVYLEGYINLDLPGANVKLADEAPELVEQLRTTEDNYYGRHSNVTPGQICLMPSMERGVCDMYGALQALPFPDESVDEILCRQVFEHLSMTEAHDAVAECNRVLKQGGVFRLSVPDHDLSMEEYRRTGDAFFKRHVLGSRKNDYAYHVMGHSKASLDALFTQKGFEFDAPEENPHFYPAICQRYRKTKNWAAGLAGDFDPSQKWTASWQYAGNPRGTPVSVPDEWFRLEVGPGANPWPMAQTLIDIEPQQEHTIKGDIHELPVTDGTFDFVFCSHVMEHVEDPVRAASELSRVALRGIVVTPSLYKESLFAFEEPTHRWHVMDFGGAIHFFPRPKWIENVLDDDMQRVAHRLFRLGSPNLASDGLFARRWFYRAEPWLDVVHYWDGELEVVVHG